MWGMAYSTKPPISPFWKAMARFEQGLIQKALKATNGSQRQAAKLLGVSRAFLESRLKGNPGG